MIDKETINYFPLSPSRINSLDCGYYFHQKYVLKNRLSEEQEEATKPLNIQMGSLGHKVMEIYNKSLLLAKLPSDMEIFDMAFEKAWEGYPYMPENMYPESKALLLNFAENNPIDPETLWGAEIKVAIDWDMDKVDWASENVWLRGILDKVDVADSMAIITDYKNFLPSESKLKNSYQTKIYPFLMKCLNPYLEKFILVYHGIKTNKKITFEFEASDIWSIEDSIKELSKRIYRKISNSETIWTARTGENCPYCTYTCPLLKLGYEPIKTMKQAMDIGNKIYALNLETGKLQKELKAYIEATDERVDIGAGEYCMKDIMVTKGIKASNVAQICLEHGIDLNSVLKVDFAKVKGLEDDEIKAEIMKDTKTSLQRKFVFEEYNEK